MPSFFLNPDLLTIFQLLWFSQAVILGHICCTVESFSVLFQLFHVVPWLPGCSEVVSCHAEPEVCRLCIRLPLYICIVVHEWAKKDRENYILHSNRLWNPNLAWEKPWRLKACKNMVPWNISWLHLQKNILYHIRRNCHQIYDNRLSFADFSHKALLAFLGPLELQELVETNAFMWLFPVRPWECVLTEGIMLILM